MSIKGNSNNNENQKKEAIGSIKLHINVEPLQLINGAKTINPKIIGPAQR